jgi:hypothetical protein
MRKEGIFPAQYIRTNKLPCSQNVRVNASIIKKKSLLVCFEKYNNQHD